MGPVGPAGRTGRCGWSGRTKMGTAGRRWGRTLTDGERPQTLVQRSMAVTQNVQIQVSIMVPAHGLSFFPLLLLKLLHLSMQVKTHCCFASTRPRPCSSPASPRDSTRHRCSAPDVQGHHVARQPEIKNQAMSTPECWMTERRFSLPLGVVQRAVAKPIDATTTDRPPSSRNPAQRLHLVNVSRWCRVRGPTTKPLAFEV